MKVATNEGLGKLGVEKYIDDNVRIQASIGDKLVGKIIVTLPDDKTTITGKAIYDSVSEVTS